MGFLGDMHILRGGYAYPPGDMSIFQETHCANELLSLHRGASGKLSSSGALFVAV